MPPPRTAEIAGAKVSFRPRNNIPSLSTGYTQVCIAGLQESSTEEPSIQHAQKLSWRPDCRSNVGKGGLIAPSQRTSPFDELRARLAPALLISLLRVKESQVQAKATGVAVGVCACVTFTKKNMTFLSVKITQFSTRLIVYFHLQHSL